MPDEESMYLQNTGAYLPTTVLLDTTDINSIQVTSPQFKNLIVQLYRTINNLSLQINLKDTGYYQTTEFVNGQLYFPNPAQTELTAQPEPIYRNVYRRVYDFGALPNTATKTLAHTIDLTSDYTFTRIYGCATNTTTKAAMPLPTSDIKLFIDATNINVVTVSDLSAYTVTYIVLEYLKQ